jgi:serine/threonine protein kinase
MTCQTGFCSEARTTNITNAGDRRKDWRSILHLNINPKNIFIGGSDSTYPYYKKSMLGDFDLALRLENNPIRHKAQFDEVRYQGQDYWQAPEKMPLNKKLSKGVWQPSEWPLDHSTDVYALGLLIRFMMCCTMDTNERPFMDFHKHEEKNLARKAKNEIADNVEFPWTVYPRVYSTALVRTVQGCLIFLPRVDASNRRPSRLTLFQLRDIIKENLARMDSMYGDAFKAAQSEPNHSLRVLFPEEDARFKVGVLFKPEIEVNIDNLVTTTADNERTEETRKSFEVYEEMLHQTPETPGGGDNRIAKLRQPSIEVLEKALEDTYVAVRQQTVAKFADTERERNLLALEHATATMKKCLNPHGVFKQYQGRKNPGFYAPRIKLITLSTMKTECLTLSHTMQDTLQEDTKNIALREADITALYGDDLETRQEKETLVFIVEGAKRRAIELQETIDALELLHEALGFGIGLLLLGKEKDIDEFTYDDRWTHALSDAHRGVWEYFWSVPDGIVIAA